MTKKIEDKLEEQKVKKREKKRFRKAKGTHFTQAKQAFQNIIEKEERAKFNEVWPSIKVANERFHNNFQTRHQVHPLGYMGFGLKVIST